MEDNERHLSRPLVIVAAALFSAGIAAGWITYLHRSAVREQHVTGTAAWWQQAVIGALAFAALAIGYRRARRAGRPMWMLRPLGRRAAGRAARLARDARPRPPALARGALALPLAALFLYGFWRAGFQVTNGLDPNATVNAWGGPTYAGAMACHYLDVVVIMAVAAWLLDRILPAAAVQPARASQDWPAGPR